MFNELAKVMEHGIAEEKFFDSLEENVTGKRTKSNQSKTAGYLKQLYSFNTTEPSFKAFIYFWKAASEVEKPKLAFVYALKRDYLLIESIDVLKAVSVGERATIELFEENLDKYHPGWLTPKTKRSVAQNIASSWKQASFLEGRIKNVKVQPQLSYLVVAFAFLLSYLDEDRGDFMLNSKWCKALQTSETRLRELAFEASKRGLLQYQYTGNVTTIAFPNLSKFIE